jgi:atypical dual specificity phosphatase
MQALIDPLEAQHPAALTLSGFGACFRRKVVLASIDLSLPSTGVDVLMGPVKVGKSTLMRSLAGLNDSGSLFRSWGTATLQGRPLLSGWQPVLVQQHAALLNATVGDAIMLQARPHHAHAAGNLKDAAQQALLSHGLAGFIPDLSASVLSLPLVWQRAVMILSYAMLKPPLLMVDEPTYGLDELAAKRLIDWLSMLGKTQKLLVALHHQGQTRSLADRVILLGGGRILAHEPSQRFFNGDNNPWVDHFVRTGSLAIASPDARAEDLSPEVEPPPPLPPAALAAIAEFAEPDEKPTAPVSAAAKTAAPSITATSIASASPTAVPATAATPAIAPARAVKTTRAALPPVSARGVEDAAKVGRAILSNYCGPTGFHWIVPGRLAGCAEPGVFSAIDYDMGLLHTIGITHLITLTEKDLDQNALARNKLSNLHLPIYDREAPSMAQTYMLVRRMQVLLDQGAVLAVHCHAGIGRTGTILAAWLIREGGLNASHAIERLRTICRTYVQTQIQEQFLQNFEQDIMRRM